MRSKTTQWICDCNETRFKLTILPSLDHSLESRKRKQEHDHQPCHLNGAIPLGIQFDHYTVETLIQ